jgi:hypothetical protein
MTDVAWIPDACTLPDVERPLRVAEFDGLFDQALLDHDRPAADLLRLQLNDACQTELRDLVSRETACCSFFTFTVTRSGAARLVLEVAVSAGHERVLDALTARLPKR